MNLFLLSRVGMFSLRSPSSIRSTSLHGRRYRNSILARIVVLFALVALANRLWFEYQHGFQIPLSVVVFSIPLPQSCLQLKLYCGHPTVWLLWAVLYLVAGINSRNCWITSVSYFLSSFTVVNDSPDLRIKRFVHRPRQRIRFAHSSVVVGPIPLKKVGGIAVVIWVGQPQFKTALFLILNSLTIEPLWVSELREVIISHHIFSNLIMSKLSVTCRHDKLEISQMAFFLVTLILVC